MRNFIKAEIYEMNNINENNSMIEESIISTESTL